MNREEVLMQLRDLLYNLDNFIEVESTPNDVKALKQGIKDLEKFYELLNLLYME